MSQALTLQERLAQAKTITDAPAAPKAPVPDTSDKGDAPKAPEPSVESKEEVIADGVKEALSKGIRVFKKLRLNGVILANGSKIPPAADGHFYAITPEMEKLLEYHATKQYGMVEEVTE